MLKKIQSYFSAGETNPVKAYDLWSRLYDDQPGNLMLGLDEILVRDFFQQIKIKDKIIADIGCGTGRHWPKIFEKHPRQLTGFDVSEGMLEKLTQKFRDAKAYCIQNDKITELDNNSCDIIISTLTIAHIQNLQRAFSEWNRILKPGSDILITDYHPEALAKGGKRTFKHEGKTISVRNYIHPVGEVVAIAAQLHWKINRLTEIIIDDEMKPWYEKQDALNVFEKFKGTLIIYGVHLKKN